MRHAIDESEAALALAESDPEGGELDWWGWARMVRALREAGYEIVRTSSKRMSSLPDGEK